MSEITRFTIPLEEDRTAAAIHVAAGCPAREALAALDLPSYGAAIALHGGAQFDAELQAVITRFLAAGLMPYAERRCVLIADGGTRAGTMAAMGDARRQTGSTFPLVGVAPYDTITYPGGPPQDDAHFPLDPGHSHFILVDGGGFGVESDLLVGIATATRAPGIALIINGGDIVGREAQLHALFGTPIITVRGSGRMADALADPASAARQKMPPGATIETVDLDAPQTLPAVLERLFGE